MHMNQGIARSFKKNFQSQELLLSQQQGPGGLAILADNYRFLYYLVTKNKFCDKPTYETLYSSLLCLKEHVLAYGIRKLAIPTLGCGLDRLNWPKVKSMLLSCFADVDMEILVCHYPKKHVTFSPKLDDIPRINDSFMPTAQEWDKWLATVRNFYLSSEVSPICSSLPGDPRPYLDVSIYTFPVRCLLDSGSSNTVIGCSGLSFLDRSEIPYTISKLPYIVSTADGTAQEVLGETFKRIFYLRDSNIALSLLFKRFKKL